MTILVDNQSVAALQAQIEALMTENAKLKTAKGNGGLKVTEKGGISMYGLGRFPVTLYRSQWEALLDRAAELKAFIAANANKLASKE